MKSCGPVGRVHHWFPKGVQKSVAAFSFQYAVPPTRIQTVANGNSIELNASPCQGFLGRLAQVMSLPCRNHTKKIQEKITNRWHNPQVHYKSLQTVPCHAPLSPSLKTHPVMFIHENNLQ